jgi:hypothetical protein
MLKAVGTRTFNEYFATDIETQEIIGRANERRFADQAETSENRIAAN